MGRIVALDFGTKRTGIAVTDPEKRIATGLTTVPTSTLRNWLKDYVTRELVETIIIGMPQNLDGSDTHATKPARDFLRLLKKDFPQTPIATVDERFTSKMASRALVDMGMKKSERRKKEMIDETAATLLLQEYLEQMG